MTKIPMLTLEQLLDVLHSESELVDRITRSRACTASGDHKGAFVHLVEALKLAKSLFGENDERCVPLKVAAASSDLRQCSGNATRWNSCYYARQLLEEVTAELPSPLKELVEMVASSNYSVGAHYGANDRG